MSRVKCSLAAALWLNAHTRDEYQTQKVLLAFKWFPNELVAVITLIRGELTTS